MSRLGDYIYGRNIDLHRVDRSAEYRGNLQTPDSELVDALVGTRTLSGQRITVTKALGLAPVWAAVSLISEQVGQLPLKVYRRMDDGERIEAREHRAWRMLHQKPNASTPADRFWQAVTANLLLWGNAFIEKVRTPDGVVSELFILDPGSVQVEWNPIVGKRFIVGTGTLGDEKRVLDEEGVLHIFRMSLDGLTGESVIGRARNAFGTALARDEFEGGFYQRGAVLSGVIQHPGRVGLEGLKNLKSSFMTIYGGSDRAHQVGVLEEGAEFKAMSHPLRDLEFVASQNMSRTDIATMFGLPPNLLGGSSGDSLTYATVEDNELQLAVRAIAPIANTIAKAVSCDSAILPQNIHEAEFVLEAMLRANAKDRAEFYKTMVEIGALHPDEVRARENYGPRPATPQPAEQPALPGLDQMIQEMSLNGGVTNE